MRPHLKLNLQPAYADFTTTMDRLGRYEWRGEPLNRTPLGYTVLNLAASPPKSTANFHSNLYKDTVFPPPCQVFWIFLGFFSFPSFSLCRRGYFQIKLHYCENTSEWSLNPSKSDKITANSMISSLPGGHPPCPGPLLANEKGDCHPPK